MAEKEKAKTVKVGDVLAKDKAPEKSKSAAKSADSKKKKHRHTHIEHHYDAKGNDAGHTVRHSGDGEEVSYSKPDFDGVHDGLEEHVGNPNEGEEMAEPVAEAQAEPQAEAAAPKPGV